MKLGNVYNSMRAWTALSAMHMKPRMAYKIHKYVKELAAEYELVEKQRIVLVRELTNTKEGEQAVIEPNTEVAFEFVNRFNEILLTDCDLHCLDLTMDELLEEISERDGNQLSAQELMLLEPFLLEQRDILKFPEK